MERAASVLFVFGTQISSAVSHRLDAGPVPGVRKLLNQRRRLGSLLIMELPEKISPVSMSPGLERSQAASFVSPNLIRTFV